MKEELINQIHDILGTLDEPELRDIKTQRIVILFARTLNQMMYKNASCSAFCAGFGKYDEYLEELLDDKTK
jgi:hypothetical protein